MIPIAFACCDVRARVKSRVRGHGRVGRTLSQITRLMHTVAILHAARGERDDYGVDSGHKEALVPLPTTVKAVAESAFRACEERLGKENDARYGGGEDVGRGGEGGN